MLLYNRNKKRLLVSFYPGVVVYSKHRGQGFYEVFTLNFIFVFDSPLDR